MTKNHPLVWLLYWPTPVQVVVDGHHTPPRRAAPFGLGLDWIAQAVPFQASARVAPKEPLSSQPTAVQLVGKAGQDEKLLSVARWAASITKD